MLQIDIMADETEIKKQFRKLSLLVHPDKNQSDTIRAQNAFDTIKNAIESLKDEGKMMLLGERFEEAKVYLLLWPL